jgi:hypothetical protein
MIAHVTERTGLRRARIARIKAHHAALRTASHSSMKAESWFQLRIVGVTAIRERGFGRAFLLGRDWLGAVS